VAKVTPFLNEALGEKKWEVDYSDPLKILTVVGEKDNLKVMQALEKAGYKGEPI
jgi:copper chaperone